MVVFVPGRLGMVVFVPGNGSYEVYGNQVFGNLENQVFENLETLVFQGPENLEKHVFQGPPKNKKTVNLKTCFWDSCLGCLVLWNRQKPKKHTCPQNMFLDFQVFCFWGDLEKHVFKVFGILENLVFKVFEHIVFNVFGGP